MCRGGGGWGQSVCGEERDGGNTTQQPCYFLTGFGPHYDKNKRSCVLIGACYCESSVAFERRPISPSLPRGAAPQLCTARGRLTEREARLAAPQLG